MLHRANLRKVAERLDGRGPGIVIIAVEAGPEVRPGHALDGDQALGALVVGLGGVPPGDAAEEMPSSPDGEQVGGAGAVDVRVGVPVGAAGCQVRLDVAVAVDDEGGRGEGGEVGSVGGDEGPPLLGDGVAAETHAGEDEAGLEPVVAGGEDVGAVGAGVDVAEAEGQGRDPGSHGVAGDGDLFPVEAAAEEGHAALDVVEVVQHVGQVRGALAVPAVGGAGPVDVERGGVEERGLDDDEAVAGPEVGDGAVALEGGERVGRARAVGQDDDGEEAVVVVGGAGDGGGGGYAHLQVRGAACDGDDDGAVGEDGDGVGDGDVGGGADLGVVGEVHDVNGAVLRMVV